MLNQINPMIEIRICNQTPRRQIVQKQHFSFENTWIDFELSNGGIFEPNQEKTIHITPNRGFLGQKLKFQANSTHGFVLFCC